MPRPANRDEVLARLHKTVAEGSIIVGAGAGMFPRLGNCVNGIV